MEGLHTMWYFLVPQGDHLRHYYFYPSAPQPATQSLPPRLAQIRVLLVSVCHSNFLQGVPSTPVTASHMTQGADIHVTLKYSRGVGFIGGKFCIGVHA